jgi:DNA-binding transcriptional ArsR family regulator
MFKKLDSILNAPLRLAIVSILSGNEEVEFNILKEKTKASSGNLSVQINKLKAAGYIDVIKKFKDNYPQTTCKITKEGKKAFTEYEDALKSYFKKE